MKKLILAIFVLFISFLFVQTNASAADYEATQMGTAVSGQDYSGTAKLNDGGNPIPSRYNFSIPSNSMIHVYLYTQSNSDVNFYVNSKDNPYFAESGGGSSFRGADLTTYGDFYKPEGQVFGSSRFGVSADKRNTREYTEMFGHLAKGNYFIEVQGLTYRFKFVIEPLKYNDDYPGGTSEEPENAANYVLGNYQEGNMIDNGPTNNNFPENNRDCYKFEVANPGKYTLEFANDGFLMASIDLLDSSFGYIPDNSNASFRTTLNGSTSEVLATYDQHKQEGRTYTKTFEIEKAGIYFIKISKAGWTAGAYKFKISSVGTGVATNPSTGGTGTTNLSTGGNDTTDPLDESEAVLKNVIITPQNPSVKVNGTLQLAADATYTNGDKETVTDYINWGTTDKNIATVDENGTVKGVGAGTASITATLEGQKFSIKIVVTGAVIKKIIPVRPVIYTKVGQQPANQINGIFSDNSKKNITKQVYLVSSNTNVIVYKNYMLKAMKKGTSVITVVYQGKKVTYKVIVK